MGNEREANGNQYSDSAKFEKFLAILPHRHFKLIVDELRSGDLSEHRMDNLERYARYAEDPSSNFSDKRINTAYKKFNKSFNAFAGFLKTEMFYCDDLFGPLYRIHPEMKHSSEPSLHGKLTKGEFLDRCLEELRRLVMILEKNYNNFVKKTSAILGNEIIEGETPQPNALDTRTHRSLPKSTSWSLITIKFINGDDVSIEMKDPHLSSKSLAKYGPSHLLANYKDMGFLDRKTKRADVQWELLKELAKYNGKLSWRTKDFSRADVEKYAKRVGKLRARLKRFFKIQDDPFYDTRKEKAFSIKLNLTPEEINKKDKEVDYYAKGEGLGIPESYGKQTQLPDSDEDEGFGWNDHLS